MKIYVDTCVILDFLQSERPNHEFSLKAMILASQKGYQLYISAKAVTDIYYLIQKVNKNTNKTIEILSCLFDFIDILDTRKDNIFSAMKMGLKDFEDAVVIDTAISNSMDVILTDNIKDFKQKLIKCYTPESFIKLLKK